MPQLMPIISAKCLKLASAPKKVVVWGVHGLRFLYVWMKMFFIDWSFFYYNDHLNFDCWVTHFNRIFSKSIDFVFLLLIIMMLISTLMVQKPILTDTIPKHHSLLFVDYAARLNFERRWFLIRDKRISGSKDLEGKCWYIVHTTLEREGVGLKLFGKRWPTLWLEN